MMNFGVMLNNEDIALIRSQTKGAANLIHFNNAGASLPPDEVVETVIDYLRDEAQYGGYETEARNGQNLAEVYELIARLINADRDEIAIMENASAAWITAFKGIDFQEGDEIITSEMEYTSNLIGLMDIKKTRGVRVNVISNDEHGNFPLQELEDAISPRTKLIAVTHIPSSGGTILPIKEIGEIANRYSVLYMVDACQSAGQLPLDVKAIKCDILSATGRKYLRAPRGTGFLYVKKSAQDRIRPLLLDQHATVNITLDGYTLRSDAQRYELYEKSRALTLGLGKAITYAINIGLDNIWHRIQFLSTELRNKLNAIPGVVVHDRGSEQCGIVTFSIRGHESAEVKNQLAKLGINVSVGAAPATLIYMEKHRLKSIIRASVHYYNTEEEINTMCNFLKQVK
jgi:cysteine desulfurase/selenocysteine lyase